MRLNNNILCMDDHPLTSCAAVRGIVTKIKDSFGFIEMSESHQNVFFHKTQIVRDSPELAVGGLSVAET